MKTRYWLIIILIVYILGGGTWALIDWKLLPCPKDGITQTPGPEIPPQIKDSPGRDPYYCGRTIHLSGEMIKEKVFRATAVNDCMTVYRDFNFNCACPLPKWTIKPGLLAGVGFMPETNRVDGLIGAEFDFMRHYKRFGVGGGVWYIQGLTSQFKAGGVKADFAFFTGSQ